MDSQRHPLNWTAIGVVVAIVMGLPGWFVLVLTVWFRQFPDPTKEPDIIGTLTTGWLPVILVLAGSVFSAVTLITLIVKRWRTKSLLVKVTSLESELANHREKTNSAKSAANQLRKDLDDARKQINQEKGQRTRYINSIENRNNS